jgi:hypothetical protein
MELNIEVFGISFADFLKNFKKTYRLPDGTYDYMAFLEVADCSSYCGMRDTYKNPNEILNELITPSFNNLKLVGGKKNMKGGQNHIVFLIIAFMYILTVSTVLAGPARETHKAKYGDKIVAQPEYPPNSFFGLFSPSQKAIDEFNKKMNEYKDFEKSKDTMLQEYNREQEIELTKAKSDLTQEETQKILADSSYINSVANAAANEALIQSNMWAIKEMTKAKELNTYLSIALTGVVGIFGCIFAYVQGIKSGGRGALRLEFDDTRFERFEIDNGTYVARRPEIENFDVDQRQRRQVSLFGRRIGGKKTRKHRKKRTNTRK